MSEGWPCWALSNHDVRRVVTRWGGERPSRALAIQLLAMLCSLRGSVCLYQGEELGLPEAELPFHALRDPYGIAFWPNFKGRDGCRTPMPWDDIEHAGFSSATPWLPVPQEHRAMCATRQEADPHSTLNAFRAFVRWRKTMPALMWGDIRLVTIAESVFAFERSYGAEKILAAFNLSANAVEARAAQFEAWRQVGSTGLLEGEFLRGRLRLPAHGAVFAMPLGEAG
jgi:alpha-glucosidase